MNSMTTIGHFSDLHGDLSGLFDSTVLPDVWVASGDFFPNITRGDTDIEPGYQKTWFGIVADEFIDRLGGRPLVWMGGNHDYADLGELLRDRGYPAYNVTPEGVMVADLRFAGFRNINYIAGEWNGETRDFSDVVARTFASDPDILVTHAPPAGILDANPYGLDYGITALTTALTYESHNIKAHFFGHAHGGGGQRCVEMDIKFCNSAEHVQFIDV